MAKYPLLLFFSTSGHTANQSEFDPLQKSITCIYYFTYLRTIKFHIGTRNFLSQPRNVTSISITSIYSNNICTPNCGKKRLVYFLINSKSFEYFSMENAEKIYFITTEVFILLFLNITVWVAV